MGILALGAIVGPYLAGWTFDIFQSYHYAWIIFTIVNVAALVLLATTPKVYAYKEVEAKAE
jgi:cyanate permease